MQVRSVPALLLAAAPAAAAGTGLAPGVDFHRIRSGGRAVSRAFVVLR